MSAPNAIHPMFVGAGMQESLGMQSQKMIDVHTNLYNAFGKRWKMQQSKAGYNCVILSAGSVILIDESLGLYHGVYAPKWGSIRRISRLQRSGNILELPLGADNYHQTALSILAEKQSVLPQLYAQEYNLYQQLLNQANSLTGDFALEQALKYLTDNHVQYH